MSQRLSDLVSLFIGLAESARILVIVGLVVVVALLALLLAALVGALRLRRASRAGRRASIAAAEVIPSTNFARDGVPCDPLNMRIVGTADQLAASLVAAGWYRADEITLVTSARISLDAVFARKYSTAPVSDLYLFGRKQDYAFEKPGTNVRQRDHVRFWRGEQPASDGRPLWIGGATRDAKVELSKSNHLPTHGIAPDVDEERAVLSGDLIRTGWVIAEGTAPAFKGPTQAKNAMGDPYHTDGLAAHLTLARTQPVPLLPRLVRQPTAGFARGITRGLRGRLPQAGRDLARQWEERRKQSQGAATPEAQRRNGA